MNCRRNVQQVYLEKKTLKTDICIHLEILHV